MIGVVTTIPVDPDRRAAAVNRITDLVEQSKREEGTVRYHAAEDLAEPNRIRFFELYEDEDAAEAHTDAEAYRRVVEALPEFADGTITTRRFEVESVGVAEFTAADAVEALD